MSELEDCYIRLERIGKSFVEKNVGNLNPREAWAVAISKATSTAEGHELAQRILQLQGERVMRAQYAPVLKRMGLDMGISKKNEDVFAAMDRAAITARRRLITKDEDVEEDEWSSQFEDAEEDELRDELRRLQDREKELTMLIRERHFAGRRY